MAKFGPARFESWSLMFLAKAQIRYSFRRRAFNNKFGEHASLSVGLVSPTVHFTILEPGNPGVYVSELNKFGRLTDFWKPKL